MQDKAATFLDRATGENVELLRVRATFDVQLLQQIRESQFSEWPVDDQPQRALGAVGAELDDRPLETRVAHLGHGHEQLASKRRDGFSSSGHRIVRVLPEAHFSLP